MQTQYFLMKASGIKKYCFIARKRCPNWVWVLSFLVRADSTFDLHFLKCLTYS